MTLTYLLTASKMTLSQNDCKIIFAWEDKHNKIIIGLWIISDTKR